MQCSKKVVIKMNSLVHSGNLGLESFVRINTNMLMVPHVCHTLKICYF